MMSEMSEIAKYLLDHSRGLFMNVARNVASFSYALFSTALEAVLQ